MDWFKVTDCEFNKKHYPDLVVRIFEVGRVPSFAIVARVEDGEYDPNTNRNVHNRYRDTGGYD